MGEEGGDGGWYEMKRTSAIVKEVVRSSGTRPYLKSQLRSGMARASWAISCSPWMFCGTCAMYWSCGCTGVRQSQIQGCI